MQSHKAATTVCKRLCVKRHFCGQEEGSDEGRCLRPAVETLDRTAACLNAASKEKRHTGLLPPTCGTALNGSLDIDSRAPHHTRRQPTVNRQLSDHLPEGISAHHTDGPPRGEIVIETGFATVQQWDSIIH